MKHFMDNERKLNLIFYLILSQSVLPRLFLKLNKFLNQKKTDLKTKEFSSVQ